MAGYPYQSFPTLGDLLNYENTKVVTNGTKSITAIEVNNIVNALANFIPAYTVNSYGAQSISTGGAISLAAPVTILSGSFPSSVTYGTNVQKEWYIMNTFGQAVPLSGVSYYDNNFIQQTTIPGKATLHIAQEVNGSWVQIASTGTGGSGGGGGNGQGNVF